MNKAKIFKHHKWAGISICFFLFMFCLSGIILNHRQIIAKYNVSRKLLPHWYHFDNWNNGLMRGTIKVRLYPDTTSRVLVYGMYGMWLTDNKGLSFKDFNTGLPVGADYRQIRAVVQTKYGLYAAGQFGLYRFMGNKWQETGPKIHRNDRFTDLATCGDSIIALSRSYAYVSSNGKDHFIRISILRPSDYDNKVSLFRTVWLLHSGELFGFIGKLIVDITALIFCILCMTGMTTWLLSKKIRRKVKSFNRPSANEKKIFSLSVLWHDKIGKWTIALTLIVALTGWCLRPPVLILLAKLKTPKMYGSILQSDNPWNDKLRMIRFDRINKDWLLSTSDGFYSLKNLNSIPQKIRRTPPVSVMGLNVFQRDKTGNWLCGSFRGMYIWNRKSNVIKDYFTGEAAPLKSGAPFGTHAISGFSNDFDGKAFPVEYYDGTKAIRQPEELATLPMSLWNLALEIHSGRIYIGSAATLIFVFVAGAFIIWCLITGYRLTIRR